MSDVAPKSDPVCLALTRPAMVGALGISQAYAFAALVLVAVVFLGTHSLLYTAAAIPALYVAGRAIFAYDVRLPEIVLVKVRYFMRCRNRQYWRGNSYDAC